MTDLKSIEMMTTMDTPIHPGEFEVITATTGNDAPSSTSIPITIMKTTGNIAYYTIGSRLVRKAIFTSALYYAGGTIVATVGLPVVLATGALLWIL